MAYIPYVEKDLGSSRRQTLTLNQTLTQKSKQEGLTRVLKV